MAYVGIVGENGHEMAQVFSRLSHGAARCFHITAPQPPCKLNILVADDASPVLAEILPSLGSEDFLLINSDDKKIFALLKNISAKLITYGFNSRACITVSSVTEDGVQVCVQRGFTNINGTELEPHEFAARSSGEASMSVLGAAAAWSVLKTDLG
ncbi:MAG: hypothetical protein FWG87_14355 [Defluviitaleaceae bacterium]|nr:hypothetical protein [Defluviitaleaceae bacterium]